MQKREFLMLAHPYEAQKHKTDGSFLSEKLDGNRCVWIPQTRGLDFQKVPFSNTNKDERQHVCTGLWSRYGKPIFAPDWFLNKLPIDHALDGELYAGRGMFQTTASYIKKHTPVDSEWRDIGFYAFDIPSWVRLFEPGRINNPNFAEKLLGPEALIAFGGDVAGKWYAPKRFEQNWNFMRVTYNVAEPGELHGDWGVLRQEQLPMNRFKAEEILAGEMKRVAKLGGEGCMLRRPHSLWIPKRTNEILKVKRMHDLDGKVVGYTYGVGKLHGLVGSVRLEVVFPTSMTPVQFDLSGFTDLERLIIPEYRSEATLNGGKYINHASISERYPLGSQVTFQYRELTEDGKPKEARYMRTRPTGI